jgi:hypothetical protein
VREVVVFVYEAHYSLTTEGGSEFIWLRPSNSNVPLDHTSGNACVRLSLRRVSAELSTSSCQANDRGVQNVRSLTMQLPVTRMCMRIRMWGDAASRPS